MTEKRNIFLIVLVLCLGACSTPEPKQDYDDARRYQAVSVMTPGVTGAHCFLQAGDMSYTTAANSRVMVRRASDPMDITCFKGAHMVGNTTVRPTVAPREATAGHAAVCESCRYPENVSIVLALRPSSIEKNNVRIWTQ